MDFRTKVTRLSKGDKEHLRYILGARPLTRTNVIKGLHESKIIQQVAGRSGYRCPGCLSLARKLDLEEEL